VKLVIALIGGPLDGVYLPANPEMPGIPTQLFIYAAEAGAWSLYVNDDASADAPACDVYALRRGALNMMGTCPPEAELYRLDYIRPLTQTEVAQIERLGERHGL